MTGPWLRVEMKAWIATGVCCIGWIGFFHRYSSVNFLLPIDIMWSSLLSDANWQSTKATSLHWTNQSFSPVFAAWEEADGSLSSYDSTAVWECSRTLQCFTEIRPRQQSHAWDSHFSSPPSFLALVLSHFSFLALVLSRSSFIHCSINRSRTRSRVLCLQVHFYQQANVNTEIIPFRH